MLSIETEELYAYNNESEKGVLYFPKVLPLLICVSIFVFIILNLNLNVPYIDSSQDVDISQGPIQTSYSGSPIIINEYTLTPVATYKLTALVMSTKNYYDENSISTIDLCVVWGGMADPEKYKSVAFSQDNRKCRFWYGSDSPVGEDYIYQNFANNHIIPANNNISYALSTINNGDKIALSGFLVNEEKKNSFGGRNFWITSTSRYDRGDDSCEIIYVTEAQIGYKIYNI